MQNLGTRSMTNQLINGNLQEEVVDLEHLSLCVVFILKMVQAISRI